MSEITDGRYEAVLLSLREADRESDLQKLLAMQNGTPFLTFARFIHQFSNFSFDLESVHDRLNESIVTAPFEFRIGRWSANLSIKFFQQTWVSINLASPRVPPRVLPKGKKLEKKLFLRIARVHAVSERLKAVVVLFYCLKPPKTT